MSNMTDKALAIKYILDHIGDGITYDQARELIDKVLDYKQPWPQKAHSVSPVWKSNGTTT